MRISILISGSRINYGHDDLYPIYRYKDNLLREAGMIIQLFRDLEKFYKKGGDVALVECRAFQKGDKGHHIGFLQKLRNTYTHVYWLDSVDPSGSDSFWAIPYVDAFFKKQLLKDRQAYTINEYDKSVRNWVDFERLPDQYPHYIPCPEEELNKLKVSWNLAFCDYRLLPWGINYFHNYFFGNPKFIDVRKHRIFDYSFRGTITNEAKKGIGDQRRRSLQVLRQMSHNYATSFGGKVSKKLYLSELTNIKVSVSPFGWGELCYRDIESIMSGCILLKPSMEHLETFPDIYIKNKTYISIDWDLHDLKEKMIHVLDNYEDYIMIAEYAQQQLKKTLLNPDIFIQRFTQMMGR
mgnify:FL=1